MSHEQTPPQNHTDQESTHAMLSSGFDESGTGQLMAAPPFQLKSGTSENPSAQLKASSGGLDAGLVNGFAASTGHDLSDVNVHRNSSKPSEVGALAYAQGNDIHLGPGQDKHLAHEASHIVQQREGRVKPTTEVNGMPVNDNQGLESEADRMGEQAAQMKALDTAPNVKSKKGSSTAPKQMKVLQLKAIETHFGEFKDEHFEEIAKNGTTIGADIFLKFKPKDPADASKIGLVQSVKNQVDGKKIAVDVTKEQQQVKSGSGDGYYIDQLSEHRNPLYATGDEPADAKKKEKMEEYDTPSPVTELSKLEKKQNTAAGITGKKHKGWGGHGHRIKNGDKWDEKEATLHDGPTLPSNKANSEKLFETAAVAIEGNQKGTYYGSVSWGMKTDAAGKLSKVDMVKESDGVPTQKFLAPAKLWNDGSARGTLAAKADDVPVYDDTLKELFKLKKEDVVHQESKVLANNIVYLYVKVDAGHASQAGKKGYMKMSDVKDKQDGKATLDLPYVEVFKTTAPITDKLPDDFIGPPLTIPTGSRVQVLTKPTDDKEGKIKVVDGVFTDYDLTIEKASMKSLSKES